MPITMTPIDQMVQQLQQINEKPKRTTADRITEELKQKVLQAINEKMPTNKIRRQFGISHATLVKIMDGKD